jgi:hypothetical protein
LLFPFCRTLFVARATLEGFIGAGLPVQFPSLPRVITMPYTPPVTFGLFPFSFSFTSSFSSLFFFAFLFLSFPFFFSERAAQRLL